MAKSILIVDDSALVRKQLRELIEPLGFEIEFAKNGKEAVDKATATDYSVITMDVNMPVMDGVTAVGEIMGKNPTPILMVSSLTSENASTTIEALEAGALDYIPKPGTMNIGREENSDEILRKVKTLSRISKRRMQSMARRPVVRERRSRESSAAAADVQSDSRDIEKVILVGASTGGPGLIEQICSSLPSDFKHPVCIVQHMPEQFTKAFAQRLDRVSVLPVHESQHNQELLPGNIYLAKGGTHMHFAKKVSGKIVIRHEENKNSRFFQPSVDEMYESAITVFGAEKINAILLTGIGDDGAEGMVAIRRGGGYTIGESEESATVYGMPKEAYERGGVMEQLPFSKIVKKIVTLR